MNVTNHGIFANDQANLIKQLVTSLCTNLMSRFVEPKIAGFDIQIVKIVLKSPDG